MEEMISLRMQSELYNRLKEEASKSEKSVSEYIRYALEEKVKEAKKLEEILENKEALRNLLNISNF